MAMSSLWHRLWFEPISTPEDDHKQCEHLLSQEFHASYSDSSRLDISLRERSAGGERTVMGRAGHAQRSHKVRRRTHPLGRHD
eukprot:4239864-Prymnesium_polylepis.1